LHWIQGVRDQRVLCELLSSYVGCDLRYGEKLHGGSPAQRRALEVTIVDTGEGTMTGGRLKRVASYIGNQTFCMTYGDGVGDVDISALVASHKKAGKKATVTAVQPPGRFGALQVEGESVTGFIEKPEGDGGWINGGFFVLEPSVLQMIKGDGTTWELEPLKGLSAKGELHAYRHMGFWQPMDTMRDRQYLEELWAAGKAPWKNW